MKHIILTFFMILSKQSMWGSMLLIYLYNFWPPVWFYLKYIRHFLFMILYVKENINCTEYLKEPNFFDGNVKKLVPRARPGFEPGTSRTLMPLLPFYWRSGSVVDFELVGFFYIICTWRLGLNITVVYARSRRGFTSIELLTPQSRAPHRASKTYKYKQWKRIRVYLYLLQPVSSQSGH